MIISEDNNYDVAIVGAGPAGSASALYLLQEGLRPLIVDKDPFPRYHIGESLTGECGARLRELGLEDRMKAAGYPVKRGVKVYGTEGKNAFWIPVKKRDKNNQLVPNETWQVRRSTFDKMLLDTALERGADFYQGEVVAPLRDSDRVSGIQVRSKDGNLRKINAAVTIDASGQSTFFANRSQLTSDKKRGRYDKQIAIFSQVTGAVRGLETASPGDTLIFYEKKNHWSWFIPIDENVVSIGVVVPAEYFKAQQCSKEQFLKKKLRSLNPQLSKRVPSLSLVEPVRAVSNFSYHIEKFAGKGFLCVGDSHRFVDPIFSFGVHFAISEAKLAAQAVRQYLDRNNKDSENPFSEYQKTVEGGQEVIQNLVDTFWDFPHAFLYFVHRRYREEMIDIFAGRIYGKSVSEEAVDAFRQILATA